MPIAFAPLGMLSFLTDLAHGMESLARIRHLYDVEREANELEGDENPSAELLVQRRLDCTRSPPSVKPGTKRPTAAAKTLA